MTHFSGQELVSVGQTISGVTVVRGGGIFVESGGSALRTTILNGGMVVGGSASHTVLGSAGYLSVGGGGNVSATTISSGGLLVVGYPGGANDTTIERGGVEILSNYSMEIAGHPPNYLGGGQSGGTIEAGGVLIVTSGATLEAVTIKDGGELVLDDRRTRGYVAEKGAIIAFTDVLKNAKAIGNTVSDFTQTVHSGATAMGTLVIDGTQILSSGGHANSSILRRGGIQIVEAGGHVSGTVISAQGSQTDFGAVTKTVIAVGGVQILSSGSVARDVSIRSGGLEIVGSGATQTGINISRGGILKLLGGRVTGVTIERGGILEAVDVASGVTIRSSVVDQTYDQTVQSGGEVIYTTVSGGVQEIDLGGRALRTTVLSGTQEVTGYTANTSVSHGKQIVYQGEAFATRVTTSGMQLISGGKAIGSVLLNGGIQILDGKGISENALVGAGSIQEIDRGGIARGTTVRSGAEIIYAGGEITGAKLERGSIEGVLSIVHNITVASGVTLAVLPGGTVRNSILDGGTEIISAYANISNNIFVTNVVFNSASVLSIQETAPSVVIAASLSGFGSGSKLDLDGFRFGSGEKLTFSKGNATENTLTVTDGVMTARITLLGQYVAAGFHHVSDGASGTTITYTAPAESHTVLANPHR